MDHYLKSLFKLYEGLPRQGPGSTKSTLRALDYIRNNLPLNANILDIGCGCGAQTFVLAEDWWINYYNPLKKRIDELTTENKSCPGMEAVINDTLEEMEFMMKYSYFCQQYTS